MGTMGAIEYVGNPGGRVVVVVVVVDVEVVVVVVVVEATVLDGGIVEVIASSAALEALEHAITSTLNPAMTSGVRDERPIFCIF